MLQTNLRKAVTDSHPGQRGACKQTRQAQPTTPPSSPQRIITTKETANRSCPDHRQSPSQSRITSPPDTKRPKRPNLTRRTRSSTEDVDPFAVPCVFAHQRGDEHRDSVIEGSQNGVVASVGDDEQRLG
jgi:hypothetical protein